MGPIHSPTGTTFARPCPSRARVGIVLRADVEKRSRVGGRKDDGGLRARARLVPLGGERQGADLGRRARRGNEEGGEVVTLDADPLGVRQGSRGAHLVGREALDSRRGQGHRVRRLVALHLHLRRRGVADARPPEDLDGKRPPRLLDGRGYRDEIAGGGKRRVLLAFDRRRRTRSAASCSPPPRARLSVDGRKSALAKPARRRLRPPFRDRGDAGRPRRSRPSLRPGPARR